MYKNTKELENAPEFMTLIQNINVWTTLSNLYPQLIKTVNIRPNLPRKGLSIYSISDANFPELVAHKTGNEHKDHVAFEYIQTHGPFMFGNDYQSYQTYVFWNSLQKNRVCYFCTFDFGSSYARYFFRKLFGKFDWYDNMLKYLIQFHIIHKPRFTNNPRTFLDRVFGIFHNQTQTQK